MCSTTGVISVGHLSYASHTNVLELYTREGHLAALEYKYVLQGSDAFYFTLEYLNASFSLEFAFVTAWCTMYNTILRRTLYL